MKKYIYADNAATTKLDIDAFEAMKPYLLDEYGNASQPYSFSRTTKKALKESRKTIAACIGAEPDEIFFTSGGTESDNWAIKGIIENGAKKGIITSQIEHHAILNACASMEHEDKSVIYLPVSVDGTVLPETLEEHITDSVKLVSIMTANNEIGTIQPIRSLSDIAHKHGAYFHTDAVQAIGHIHVNVNELGVDMLSASAHKFNGPKGTGFLYIRKGTPMQAFHHGGAQEHGYRAGTEDVASIVGMAVALKKNVDSIETNTVRLNELENSLIIGLSGLDFIRNGSIKHHLPGNISLSFNNADGEAILHRLDLMGILISTGSACDSVHTQVSHVIRTMGLKESYAKGTVRISLGKHNTESDVAVIAKAISQIIRD